MEKSQEHGQVGNNLPNGKRDYETPRLTIHGTVDTITKGNDLGTTLDAPFTTSMIKGRTWLPKDQYS
jgi:hypothetical protein